MQTKDIGPRIKTETVDLEIFYGCHVPRKGFWKNKKNGKKYLVTGYGLCTTNGAEGSMYVHYEVAEGAPLMPFTRDAGEFYEKFTHLGLLGLTGKTS